MIFKISRDLKTYMVVGIEQISIPINEQRQCARRAVLGDLLDVGTGLAGDAAEMEPIREENTRDGAGDHQGREACQDEPLGEVETEDSGAVPAHNQQAEVFTAAQAGRELPSILWMQSP